MLMAQRHFCSAGRGAYLGINVSTGQTQREDIVGAQTGRDVRQEFFWQCDKTRIGDVCLDCWRGVALALVDRGS